MNGYIFKFKFNKFEISFSRSPCVNGVCVCPAQYTGTFCGFGKEIFFFRNLKILSCLLVNPCNNSICLNGGLCTANYNSTSVSFTCTCQSLYTGQYCERSIYTSGVLLTSCASACLNSGSCINGVCMCTSQYVGPSCQYSE